MHLCMLPWCLTIKQTTIQMVDVVINQHFITYQHMQIVHKPVWSNGGNPLLLFNQQLTKESTYVILTVW